MEKAAGRCDYGRFVEGMYLEFLAKAVLDYLEQPQKVSQLVDTFESIHKDLKQGTNQRAADAVLRLVEQSDP